MPLFDFISSGRSLRKRLPLEKFVNLSPGTGEVVCSMSFIQLSYCSFSFLTWKFGSELTSRILFIVLLV